MQRTMRVQLLLSCTPRLLTAGAMRLAADRRLSARFVMQMPTRQDKGAIEAGSVEAAQHHIHQQCKDNPVSSAVRAVRSTTYVIRVA
jgi:hypothetical protein